MAQGQEEPGAQTPLAPLFPGGVMADHRQHVSSWWGEVLGGPTAYTPWAGTRGCWPTTSD